MPKTESVNTNYPSASSPSKPSQKDNKNSIIILLIVALIGSWIYFIFARNQSNNVIEEKNAQYATLDSAKTAVQQEYDLALVRLDGLTQSNKGLDSLVKTRNAELDILKSKFRSLVGKQNATAAELAEAKKLVGQLNVQIDDYVREIERLQAENQQLNIEKGNLTAENKTLNENLSTEQSARKNAEDKVDIGSTLHASNFNIEAIFEKKSGKEKITGSSRRADKLRISFTLDENRIATSGTKQLFIVAKDPSGKVIKEDALASGTIGSRVDGQVDFTTKLEIEYKQSEPKTVGFDLRQTEKYTKGTYSIWVYQNGYKIGQGSATLR